MHKLRTFLVFLRYIKVQFSCPNLLVALILHTMISISCSNECRSVTSINRYALKGHAYRSVKNKQLVTCVVTCDNDPNCYSINYIFTTQSCELSQSTRVSHPGDFIYMPDSVYLEHLSRPAGSCSGDMPCRNRGTCVNVPKAPGYRCFCRDDYIGEVCDECSSPPLGLSNNRLPNDKITGTSNGQWLVTFFYPYMARLNGPSSWVSSWLDNNPYLEINLAPKTRLITKIATQGSPEYGWWTTKYTVKHSLNRATWTYYTFEGKNKIFPGNSDKHTVVEHTLNPPIKAQYIILSLLDGHTRKAIRLELYGCYAE